MDQFFEALLEGFFESFINKIKEYIADIEHKVTAFGTGIGTSIATAVIVGLWDDVRGRLILLIFGLWAVYIARVFIHDMIVLYLLATENWRVTMFIGVTVLLLHFITRKGKALEQDEETEEESTEEEVKAVVMKSEANPKTTYSYWWTSVKTSNGTITEETTMLKMSADGKDTQLDVNNDTRRNPSKKMIHEMQSRDDSLTTESGTLMLQPTNIVAADELSTVQISADGKSIFAAGIDPAELETGLQLRSNVPFPAGKSIYFEVRVGIKDPQGWMGIGLCKFDSPRTGMPGWYGGSFAYHGDDGTLFLESQEGKPYGPTWSMFDTIGCGVDYEKKEMFFTKNGKYIGRASKAPRGELFAVVGLGYKGARFSVNFGGAHFHYNKK